MQAKIAALENFIQSTKHLIIIITIIIIIIIIIIITIYFGIPSKMALHPKILLL